jgi:hypothetical protein
MSCNAEVTRSSTLLEPILTWPTHCMSQYCAKINWLINPLIHEEEFSFGYQESLSYVEPKCPLPCSQQCATGSYHVTDECSPQLHIPYLMLHSSNYVLVSKMTCSIQLFRTKFCKHFLSFSFLLRASSSYS